MSSISGSRHDPDAQLPRTDPSSGPPGPGPAPGPDQVAAQAAATSSPPAPGAPAGEGAPHERLGARLSHGTLGIDFVGRRRLWYTISGVILVVVVVGLFTRGLTLGIEFRGGSEFTLPAPASAPLEPARAAVAQAGLTSEATVQRVGTGTLRVQTEQLSADQARAVQEKLAAAYDVPVGQVAERFIGPSWGAQITGKALQALVVFLVVVSIFLWAYFREWRTSVAALAALFHDVLVTVGVYALAGLEVTPATVIGVLTILGYSLYDTVVVFDKVRENTAGLEAGSRMTYSEAANLAVNQTLIRSINTSVAALLPVGAILGVGAGLLGAGTLRDLSLALFVGMLAGTYSSIFLATPLLAHLKEQEPAMRALRTRVESRRRAETVRAAAPAGPARGREAGPQAQATAGAPASPAGAAAPGASGASAGAARRPTGGSRPQPRRGGQRRPSGKKRR